MGREENVEGRISVVIPAYNAMYFIEACLESVLRQTYRNLEILLIDDASTDETYEICEVVAKEDNRIRLVRMEEHLGVSAARNAGMELAGGDYVFFMDSDDLIHPHLLEVLLWNAEESGADLIGSVYCRQDLYEVEETYRRDLKKLKDAVMTVIHADDGKHFSEEDFGDSAWRIYRGSEGMAGFHQRDEYVLRAIGGKMFRRETLNGLRFRERYSCGEDTLFLYEFLRGKRTIAILQKPWYYYRFYQDSASNRLEASMDVHRWDVYREICDREYRLGHSRAAVTWEQLYMSRLRQQLRDLKLLNSQADMRAKERPAVNRAKERPAVNRAKKRSVVNWAKERPAVHQINGGKAAIRKLRKHGKLERRNPVWKDVPAGERYAFRLCFGCYPLYRLNRILLMGLQEWRYRCRKLPGWRNRFELLAEYVIVAERKSYLLRQRLKLKNRDFSIIAANCNGAAIYQDLGLEYRTPTVGLRFYMDDYVKLIGNLEYYMSLPMEKMEPEEAGTFPWGKIGDIPVALVHYDTFEEAQGKWESRKQRINWDNLYFMGIDGDRCSEETIEAFERVKTPAPQSHKVLFARRPHPGLDSVYYVPGFEKMERVGVLLDYKKFGWRRRRYLDDYDYLGWLNGKSKE